MKKLPNQRPQLLRTALKVLGYVIVTVIVLSFVLMARFWFVQQSQKEVIGVSFSQVQAERFGSDWRANYTALLDDLGFRNLRVAMYWDRLEPQPGQYDFSETDYMVEQAKVRGAKLTMVVGQRTIRVPECYYPAWLDKYDSVAVGSAESAMLKAVVDRYKNEPTVEAWQVENEFLLKSFGECPKQNLTRESLERAVDTVKSSDSTRPIILTQSNQTGFPVFGPFADIFGFSMYRWVWSPYGYYMYPQTGIYNWWKAAIINAYSGQQIKVHELQAEPWDNIGNENLDYTRSFQTMNPAQLFSNIEYARQTQIKRIDLWGSEWWYAMLQKGHPEMWNTIRALPNKQ